MGGGGEETGATRPLVARFPGLASLPFAPLAHTPTPVQALHRLQAVAGLDVPILVKRDDLTSALFGGNKVRKLELPLGQALAAGATALLTAGSVGSNHVLATALHGQRLGLKVVGLVRPQAASTQVRRNLLLAHRHGAELLPLEADVSLRSTGETVRAHLDALRSEGHRPRFIPFVGMDESGAVGYVNAAFELVDAISAGKLPRPDSIYVAVGSSGTAVGLALGLKAAGLPVRVVGVRVVGEADASEQRLAELFAATCRLLRGADPSFPELSLSPGDIQLHHGAVGRGYGWLTQAGLETARRVHETEGLWLDGCYTAKAFTALLEDVRGGVAGRQPLFWHTSDGLGWGFRPEKDEWRALPPALHGYFQEGDSCQPLDASFASLEPLPADA
ncbi:1-aminocyclopropane-1-carboxylate deaminase/D-cysteine desulfhydrase [Pyxidicoccus trucidator]|uniref:1-aminocyclopropane-1-carboxylate deaminase/D-cysteine desulfhydrase n=1 Tax=Pyxidicoccus trucidator TaxID=2709662 RepID=UPI0013DBBC19|nr:pyridoxal-phosphate dependent enzyme [Pyxidicoccus trucidator]